MIKRILVALDPDEDTPVATQYAAELAQRFDAEVSGLAIVDTHKIMHEVGTGGAVGAMYYAEKVRETFSDRAHSSAGKLTEAFHTALAKAQVRHGGRVEDGVPNERIIEDMKYHDLLVMGRTSHFFYHHPEQETNTLAKVVKHGVAPTLVVGDTHRIIQRVLLTYDGSDASARTIQRFVQLKPFGTHLHLEVLHIRSNDTERAIRDSELLLRLMGALIYAHGFTNITETSMDGEDPAVRILEVADRTNSDLIVVGAHAVSAVHRLAFGSTTHTLLEESTVPLFLFH